MLQRSLWGLTFIGYQVSNHTHQLPGGDSAPSRVYDEYFHTCSNVSLNFPFPHKATKPTLLLSQASFLSHSLPTLWKNKNKSAASFARWNVTHICQELTTLVCLSSCSQFVQLSNPVLSSLVTVFICLLQSKELVCLTVFCILNIFSPTRVLTDFLRKTSKHSGPGIHSWLPPSVSQRGWATKRLFGRRRSLNEKFHGVYLRA